MRLGLNSLWACIVMNLGWVFSVGAINVDSELMETALNEAVAENQGYGGGILRIAVGSDLLWEGASGRLAGASSASISADSPFEIASISKFVTAVVVLRLIEQGRFGLESTIGELLPAESIRGFRREITVRQLLQHTSGLPDYWTDGPKDQHGNTAFERAFLADPARFWHPPEMIAYASLISARRPLAAFDYSDTNYVLLGLIIERVTGLSFHEVCRKEVFLPLGMKDTWLSYRERRSARATAHRFEGKRDLFDVPHQSADWAGGGLISTAKDLELLLRGVANGKLFRSPETIGLLLKGVPTGENDISYGLGIYRIQLDGGLGEIWGHDGHGNAFAFYWPQQDLTFTGTLNQTDNDWWVLFEQLLEEQAGVYPLSLARDTLAVEITTAWDSLYMYRGVNALAGNSIYWTDVTLSAALSPSDTLAANVWYCVGLGGITYQEMEVSGIYAREMGPWTMALEYSFSYGVGGGSFTSHELEAGVSRSIQAGPVVLVPTVAYAFNIGPDSATGQGFAGAGSSYLVLRLDAEVPVYRDLVFLHPWTAFGVNFGYNERVLNDEETAPFNGPNNLEWGALLRCRLSRWITLSGFAALSAELIDLSETAPATLWGGVALTFSL